MRDVVHCIASEGEVGSGLHMGAQLPMNCRFQYRPILRKAHAQVRRAWSHHGACRLDDMPDSPTGK